MTTKTKTSNKMTQPKVDKKNELCKNCGRPVNEPREDMPKLSLRGIGQSIYGRILGGKFKSIKLCNFCYSAMSAFRHSLSEEDRRHYEK